MGRGPGSLPSSSQLDRRRGGATAPPGSMRRKAAPPAGAKLVLLCNRSWEARYGVDVLARACLCSVAREWSGLSLILLGRACGGKMIGHLGARVTFTRCASVDVSSRPGCIFGTAKRICTFRRRTLTVLCVTHGGHGKRHAGAGVRIPANRVDQRRQNRLALSGR